MISLLLLLLTSAILIGPAWWLAGRLQNDQTTSPIFRLLCAVGLVLVGYIVFVNLLGLLTGNSIVAVVIYLLLNVSAIALLLWKRPLEEFRPIGIISTWRTWIFPVVIAFICGFPQWFMAVSSPLWDEVACSSIHLTAPSQFAEGIFPPRHNALPDIGIKYHYAVTMLEGTVKLLLGISSNVAIDVVSTSLWLFTFLFIYFWFRRIKFDSLVAYWGAFATLLGGGLSWIYLPRIEAYRDLDKAPPPSTMLHNYDAAKSWLTNLINVSRVPSQHLRNADGSLSNLPWDIAAQFQQHTVALGIALTVVALYLFTNWQKRNDRSWPLLAINIVAFSVIFLGHAVFGAVSAFSSGICLLLVWLKDRTWRRFTDGLIFTAGVFVLALLSGGMMARGAQYGTGAFVTLRKTFGYWVGGFWGFFHWNIAGFGLLLLFSIVAVCLHRRRRDPEAIEQNVLFTVLTIFALFSYFIPQVVFYSSDTYGVEQYTEISKFFFSAHFALALLSAFGVAYLQARRSNEAIQTCTIGDALPPCSILGADESPAVLPPNNQPLLDYLQRTWRWWVFVPCLLGMAISPLLFCFTNSVDDEGKLIGFYHSSYHPNSIEEQMGDAIRRLKKTNHDVYFDASADERRHGFLSEMLNFGGSVFTMTPSRFERNGVGFRLSDEVVAKRYVQNGRMARLLPGAPEEVGCNWYYCHPLRLLSSAPVIVRSRFAKLVAEGMFNLKFSAGERALYSIDKPTADLDQRIELYWSPKIIAQTVADCDGDGNGDLIFYDYVAKKILCDQTTINLPEGLPTEFVNLYVARFPGSTKSDFLVGRMKDTFFKFGTSASTMVEYSGWVWSYFDSKSGKWQPEYERWFWDQTAPIVADIDHSGFASHIVYNYSNDEWMMASGQIIPGPKVDRTLVPVPFAGRFLEGSDGDLGLWSIMNATVTLQTIATGKSVSFRMGGTYGYILVPGDYDGDGRDEIAVYNQEGSTWFWKHAPDGPVTTATFGTKTGIPLPWDYNHDGRLDVAYWEPSEGKIYVSFTRGKSVDLTISVPLNSIPAFVNMY